MRINGLFIVLILLSYLFGSINFAILLTYLKSGIDIREIGDHNAGAENVGRNIDWKLGFLVGILDGLKGFLPLIFAKWISVPNAILLTMSAAATLGHDYPLYYQFKGGSGVATTIGCALFFAPKETILIYLFILPVGFSLQYMRRKIHSLPKPSEVTTFTFYMFFLSLVFIPRVSNVVKMFSIISLSIIVLKKSDIAFRFITGFFTKLYGGSKR